MQPGGLPTWWSGGRDPFPLLLLQLLIGVACTIPSAAAAAANETTQGLVEVHVSTGQELADAVADWGASGSDMTIYIDVPYISVRNASFTSYSTIAARSRGQPFSQGVLTITGQKTLDSQPVTILDAGMRSGLLPLPLTYPARYSLENTVIINLCEQVYPYVGGGFAPPTPFAIALMGLSLSYQSQGTINTVTYGRPAALAFQTYRVLMQATPIKELKALAGPVAIQASDTPIEPIEATAYTRGVKYYYWALGVAINSTQKSLSNPGDPVLMQLRSEGKLMPPQFCNGTLLPEQLVNDEVDAQAGPLRAAADQSVFVRALELTTAQTHTQLQIKGPPAALVINNHQYTVPDAATYTVVAPMLISGNDPSPPPSDAVLPWIDLHQRADIFNMMPGALMMMQGMALTGLAAQVPILLPPGLSPDNVLPSVFPLAAFKSAQSPDTWHNSSSVVMFNTTLVIPPDDYLALLILASRQAGQDVSSCTDAATLQRVAQLQAGFSNISFSLPTPDAYLQPPLLLGYLQGWGLSATKLRVLPSSSVQVPACSSVSKAPTRGPLIIGLAVGMPSACVLAVALTVCLKHHHQGQHKQRGQVPRASQASSQLTNTDEQSGPFECRPAQSTISATSALVLCVQRAWQSNQTLLQSTAATASSSGHVDSSTTGGLDGTADSTQLTCLDLHSQIRDLAAQMSQDDKNQLSLCGVLGTGGSGTVFIGIWKGLQVAVKSMLINESRAGLNEEPQRAPRAIMEAAIAASVGHPNLVATYHYDIRVLSTMDASTDKAGGLQINSALPDAVFTYKLFLIQELCDISLSAAVASRVLLVTSTNELDLPGVFSILVDVACGLRHLHKHGIIHGDLKPENIMLKLSPGAQEGVVAKLTDFGLSMKLGPGATHVSNVSHGTPFYVAPEVVHHHQISTASDVYSFAIVMWVVVTQQKPFVVAPDGRFVPNPAYPHFPDNLRLPQSLKELFARCCAHDPQQRPAVDELVRTLNSVLLMSRI